MACAAALTPLFLVGLWELVRSRRHGLGLCVLFFLAAIAHLVYQKHHPYGAYKLFNVSWWCVVAALGAGCEWALRQARRVRAHLLVAPCLALLALAFAYWGRPTQHMHTTPLYRLGTRDFMKVRQLRPLLGAEPVLLPDDDWLAFTMALYALRDLDCYPYLLRDPQKDMFYRTEQCRPVPAHARYKLTGVDDVPLNQFLLRSARPVATAGPYHLWDLDVTRRGAGVVSIENPNGVESWGPNGTMTWLGTGEATVHVLAPAPGHVSLNCNLGMGPSLPEKSTRTLKVSAEGGYQSVSTVATGPQSLTVPVRPGMNRVRLQVLDAPTVARTSPADGRTLLLLVGYESVRFRPASGSPTSDSGGAVSDARHAQ
jgi:hypothetical protein